MTRLLQGVILDRQLRNRALFVHNGRRLVEYNITVLTGSSLNASLHANARHQVIG